MGPDHHGHVGVGGPHTGGHLNAPKMSSLCDYDQSNPRKNTEKVKLITIGGGSVTVLSFLGAIVL